MKPYLHLSLLAFVLITTARPCFGLWDIAEVSKEVAKELGVEVRSIGAGPEVVRVEMEFKLDGKLKDFSRVDLRVGEGDVQVVASLLEDRTQAGRVVVSFSAPRKQLEKIHLWVMVPGGRGGIAYDIRVTDFVEAEKAR